MCLLGPTELKCINFGHCIKNHTATTCGQMGKTLVNFLGTCKTICFKVKHFSTYTITQVDQQLEVYTYGLKC